MKKLISVVLLSVLLLSLCACGKSDAAKAMDSMIKDLGTITLESEEAIVAAEKMYEALTEDQKAELDNYALLVAARMELDKLIAENVPTKEELLSQAVSVSATQINNDTIDNIVKAKQQYCGKILEITGYVVEIEEDHIQLGATSSAGGPVVDVYLSVDEIVNLERMQYITIVGQMGDEVETTVEHLGGYDWETVHFDMRYAYFVKDTYEYVGEYRSRNTGLSSIAHGDAYTFDLDGNIYLDTVYIPKSVDTSELGWGDMVTFTAKVIDGDRLLLEILNVE